VPTSYLENMQATFASALESGLPRRAATLSVDDVDVALVCAGDDMARASWPALAPCLSAGESPRGVPALTIELWDSASARIQPPAAPWSAQDAGPLGAVRGHNTPTRRVIVDPGSRTITVADLQARRAVLWAQSAAELPTWWRAVPLRLLLSWATARSGRRMVHAGAVGDGGRGVLLAGSGGTGKSTVAVTCLDAGMDYVADDYLLLSGSPGMPRVHALYGTAKLDERSLQAFPMLVPAAMPPSREGEKWVLDLHALRPSRLAGELDIAAVVLPRLTGGERPSLERVSAATALLALAPSTIFQAPDGGAEALALIADVLRVTPAYELRVGEDLGAVPALLGSLVSADA